MVAVSMLSGSGYITVSASAECCTGVSGCSVDDVEAESSASEIDVSDVEDSVSCEPGCKLRERIFWLMRDSENGRLDSGSGREYSLTVSRMAAVISSRDV